MPVDVAVTAQRSRQTARAVQQGGGLVGMVSSSSRPGDVPVDFVDWPFMLEQPSINDHVEVVRREAPALAVAPDVDPPLDLETVLDVARELDRFADTVIVVPKSASVSHIPRRYRVGVPFRDEFKTDTGVNVFPDFRGRPVHVLGGNPTDHFALADRFELDVASVDSPNPLAWADGGRVWVGRRRGADDVDELVDEGLLDSAALEAAGLETPLELRVSRSARITFTVRNLLAAWNEPGRAVEVPRQVAPGRGPPPPMDEPIDFHGETISIEEQREMFLEATEDMEIGRVEREEPAETAPATLERFGAEAGETATTPPDNSPGMSAAADANGESQVVRFTVNEARVLGGAFNVICEIIAAPGLELPAGIAVNRQRQDLFDRLAALFANRIESGAIQGAFEEPLDPAEAQAIRDVVGALETLLQDPGGREKLAAIGFLVRPDQPVDREEVELLEGVIDRIEPTGVRAAGAEEGHLDRIDQLRSELGDIRDITTVDRLNEHITSVLPRSAATCDQLLVSLAEVTQVAFQAAKAREDIPQRRWNFMKTSIDEAVIEILEKAGAPIEADEPIPGPTRDCLPDDALLGLLDSIRSVYDPIEGDLDGTSARAFAALSDIHNAFQDPRRGGGMAA